MITDGLVAGDLAAFARANGWRYDSDAAPPALGGDLWEQATSGVVRDRVSGPGWEAGHLTGGSRTASRTEQRGGWTVTTSVSVNTPRRALDLGYLALTLPRRLPHFLLDATSNNGLLSSLQHPPRADQALSLEGDFDRHFRLYAPRGYERDALYVFTPDLMALLIDEAGDLDVEVRDDRLIVYRPGGFDLRAPETWERFERIRATVGSKTWSQTDMYADDRVATPGPHDEGAPNPVGVAGRRLRRRLPRTLWLGVGIAVAALAITATIATVVLVQVLSHLTR